MRKEILVAATVGSLLVLYTAAVALSPRVTMAPYLFQLVVFLQISMSTWLLVGIVCFLGHLFLERRRTGAIAARPLSMLVTIFRERWEHDRLTSLLFPPLMIALLLTSFGAFKQLILPTAGFHLDPSFAAADRALFGGRDAWQVTHGLISSPWGTAAIDWIYHTWFLPILIGVLLCSFPRGRLELRAQYLLAYPLVWIVIGSGLAFVLSSVGPVYFAEFIPGSSPFAPLVERLHAQEAAIQAVMPEMKIKALFIQKGLLTYYDQAMIGTGISAMPSMHISLATLFSCAAWSLGRTWGWLATVYGLLIWIGSIHLGWHYAVDGLVAAPLTIGIWWLSGAFVRRLLAETPWRLAPT